MCLCLLQAQGAGSQLDLIGQAVRVCVSVSVSVCLSLFVYVSVYSRLKVRGHNLIWSVGQYVQHWVQQLSGNDLRWTVRHHIEDTMNVTRGL